MEYIIFLFIMVFGQLGDLLKIFWEFTRKNIYICAQLVTVTLIFM